MGLHASGHNVVLVHGGGNAATEWLKIHGVASQFFDGLRVTGPDAIDVVTAVFAGLVNKQLVSQLNALGGNAWGLAGPDGQVIATRQLDERLGFVGEITAIKREPLDLLVEAGYLPVLAPIGYWEQEPQRLMNINADTVAGHVAAALGASDLVFLTDVAHVRDASENAISRLHPSEVEPLIDSGVASGGMIPKLMASMKAASAGVRCLIADGREPNTLRAVLNGEVRGTLVTA